MKTLTNILTRIIDTVGYFCGFLMLLMLLNVFYDVVMRYLFNDVSIAMQELEWHIFASMFMFGIGYTLKEDGHVRVDIIYDKLSTKVRAWIDILGSLFFALPISVVIIYHGFDYSHQAFSMHEGSADPGGLPHRWIIRSVVPISSLFFVLCLTQVILVKVQKLRGIDNRSIRA